MQETDRQNNFALLDRDEVLSVESAELSPDEPELTNSSEENDKASSQTESPLDDIRRTIVD
jgi:hypothetical protein